MNSKSTFIISFTFLTIFSSCIRQITPPIRQSAPLLVVEGVITTDSAPYTIKLSYAGKFIHANVDSTQDFINDARVIIKDDAGDSSSCTLTTPGTYQSTDSSFIGMVGHTYTLEVYLSNGKTYVSKPEKINQVPPIDSITASYDSSFITDVRPTQLIIAVNTPDPPQVQNYYRWTASGYIPRKSWGVVCSYPYPPCSDPFSCSCNALCLQYISYTVLNVLSDQLINGHEIIQSVFYSPLYWFGKHYIEIKQYSLNQDTYLFWEQYLEQTTRTGSILDPFPSSLTGNIYNLADSNDVALGYFGASATVIKKVIIIPFFLQQYYLESIAGEYIPRGDCSLTIPNSLGDNASPTGWENAEVIQLQ
jgi:Domain of unknown function (DUF4249)